MIASDSPFKNLPRNLDRKQAFFLDGLRHAVEICDLAYQRLTSGIAQLALTHGKVPQPDSYAVYFLDAWAFVDAVDRFRCLWAAQPNAASVPSPHTPKALQTQLSAIRRVRNIADHIAQRADQSISINAAALGILAWVTHVSDSPLVAKTCLIRPGHANGTFNGHFSIPQGTHHFVNGCTNVRLHAGNDFSDLTEAYKIIEDTVAYAEKVLRIEFSKAEYAPAAGSDMFAIADLDFDAHGDAA